MPARLAAEGTSERADGDLDLGEAVEVLLGDLAGGFDHDLLLVLGDDTGHILEEDAGLLAPGVLVFLGGLGVVDDDVLEQLQGQAPFMRRVGGRPWG